MQIVATKEVEFATASRTGYAASLAVHLKKMKPGQSLLVEVDYSDLEGMDEEGLQAFKESHKIKSKMGEDDYQAISRWIANRQRTRIMASLDPSKLPEHYYHTKLVAPEDGGIVTQIAIVCDPIEQKPVRAPRKAKAKG